MKTLLKNKFFLIGSILVLFTGFGVYLFFDGFYARKFRTMQDEFLTTTDVNLTGLRELRASGSDIVNLLFIKQKLRDVKGTKIIVDGIQEFHGYIHGIPTTLLGYNTSPPAFRHYLRRLLVTDAIEIRPDFVISGQNEAKAYEFEYKNIKMMSKSVPADESVDELVTFLDNLSEDTWLHFYCHNGRSRTSMMLVMFDIMKNAPKVSLYDIVKRQAFLGSENLFNMDAWQNSTYDKQMLEARKKFIEEFYQFVCQRKTGGIQRWSDWHQTQKKETS
ncbi:MAG: hypothetical protein K2W92_01850 [Alphaproteobacteria bacterium]|nr:hypothetical protein [Alphaproteobacteria bacterium]